MLCVGFGVNESESESDLKGEEREMKLGGVRH